MEQHTFLRPECSSTPGTELQRGLGQLLPPSVVTPSSPSPSTRSTDLVVLPLPARPGPSAPPTDAPECPHHVQVVRESVEREKLGRRRRGRGREAKLDFSAAWLPSPIFSRLDASSRNIIASLSISTAFVSPALLLCVERPRRRPTQRLAHSELTGVHVDGLPMRWFLQWRVPRLSSSEGKAGCRGMGVSCHRERRRIGGRGKNGVSVGVLELRAFGLRSATTTSSPRPSLLTHPSPSCSPGGKFLLVILELKLLLSGRQIASSLAPNNL